MTHITVDLTDTTREPSDEELEFIMQAMCDQVVERHRRTEERFFSDLAERIARTVSDQNAHRSEAEVSATDKL